MVFEIMTDQKMDRDSSEIEDSSLTRPAFVRLGYLRVIGAY